MGLMGRRKYAQVFGSGTKFPQARLKKRNRIMSTFIRQSPSSFACLYTGTYSPTKVFHGSFACPSIAAIQQILRQRRAPMGLGSER
jgi:hypothetical protein